MEKEEFIASIGKLSKRVDVDEVYGIVDNLVGLDKEQFLERIVTYSSVLQSGRYKVEDYVKAVHFCSLVGIGENRTNAYRKTFPERVAKKKTESTIQSSASIYASGELVQRIMAQSMIPAHMMFQAEEIKAFGVLADLMVNADSQKVQMESADKLIGRLNETRPKEAKIKMDIGLSNNDPIADLSDALTNLAVKQKEFLDGGQMNLKQIAESKIIENVIDAEVE